MIICEQCEAEFKVKVHNELAVKFCPCCGEALHDGEDWDEMDPVNFEDED